jgi:predicted DNA-binding protein (UPF0251 family)
MAPHFEGFKPQGTQCNTEAEVLISFEEYEALNLCDDELLTQAEAASLMNVSRPTFTRVYESVRRKIAKAFVEGSCIRFSNGNTELVTWFRCPKCQISFTIPENDQVCCPFCKEEALLTTN